MTLFRTLLLCAVAFSLTACGNKGKLKSPSEIEAQAAKKAAREAKKAKGEALEPEEVRPPVSERESYGQKIYPITPSNEVAQ